MLNVRSGPGESFRVLGQLRENEKVEVLEEATDGWAWVEPPGGWVAGRFLEDSKIPSLPSGLSAIMRTFGQPATPVCSSGLARLPEPLLLSWHDSRISQFACHLLMEDIFTQVFHRIHSEGFWKDLKSFGGCYANRPIKDSSKRSTHAWGIAVDLNPDDNRVGTEGTLSKDVVRIFEDEGFVWGGRFTRRDPMHFQYATGY